MRGIWTLYKKEMKEYFHSSIAYVFLIIFIIIPNILFFFYFGGIFKEKLATMRIFFMILPYSFIVFIAGLTMGSWAQEKNAGTNELLFTFPIKEWQVLLGKFLSAFTLVVIALSTTLFIPLLTQIELGEFDWGQLFTQYFGALLLASCYITITFFLSSLTNKLIDSFLLSASILLSLNIIGYLPQLIKFPDFLGLIKEFLVWISLSSHFSYFSKGVINSKDILFYLGLSVIFFYLNLRSIESRKWS